METLEHAIKRKFNNAANTGLDYGAAAQSIADVMLELDLAQQIIGIFGQGTSGKSYLAKLLQESLAMGADILCSDDFLYPPQASQSISWSGKFHGKIVRGRPTACDRRRTDLMALTNAIRAFRQRQKIIVPNYLGYSRSNLSVSLKKYLIIEGIGASFLDMTLFDVTIFLDISEEEELRRRFTRNGHSIEEAKANGFDVRRAQYEINILPRIPGFDLVFQTDESFMLHQR